MSTEASIQRHLPSIIELRHRLHRIPELQFQETKTAATIRQHLDVLKIPWITAPSAPTATIAWIGPKSIPCIALRADIDALPVTEATGLPYASQHPGCMHACGHDGHTAALLGAVAVLKDHADQLNACVKFIFQPAEETGGGAGKLVEAGVLDGRLGPKVDAIFGLHGWPGLKIGMVASKPGPLMAATGTFDVRFIGRGCHAAQPHLGRDPIVAAAEAVISLQQVPSRDVDPTEPVVVTVGQFHAGSAYNIIPDEAAIQGTVRTMSEEMRATVQAAMERRCAGIAEACDCRLEFQWSEGYPPTINDPALTDYVASITRQVLGENAYLPVARPTMGGEDFSYYLQKIPGCFFMIGVQPADRSEYPQLHNERYNFPDEALPVGMRMFAELALRYKASGQCGK